MSRPRILFVCPTLGVGGAERQWATLLPRLEAANFRVTVLTLNHRGAFFEELAELGIDVRHAGMRNRLDLAGVRAALAVGRIRPAVIVSQSIDAHVIAALIAARTHTPLLHVEHSGPGISRPRRHSALYTLVAPRAKSVVAVSSSQIEALQRLGYARNKIRVIPNGLPPPTVKRDRADVRVELGLPEAAFVALLVASLRPEKRAPMFVDAISLSNRIEPSVRGVIAGNGPDLQRVSASDAARDGTVIVLGYRADVGDLINAADVVCLTSAVEAAPMSVLEAMSLARPVVAMSTGGLHELIDSTAGILVDHDPRAFADAVVQLAHQPRHAAQMGAAGRARYLSRFTPEQMTDAYAELLTNLIGHTASRR